METKVAVRCKMICQQVSQQIYSNPDVIHGYRFQVVTTGSEDDKKYFAWTPSGSLEFGALRGSPFEVGKKYYVTVEEAPE